MYIVTLICFVSLILFYFKKISPRLFMLILGVYVLLDKSNIEGMSSESSSCGCGDLNSEALQNIASIYNNNSLTITDLNVTGKLTVGGSTTCAGLLTASGGIAATNMTASGTLTVGDATKGTGLLTANGGIAATNMTASGTLTVTGNIDGGNCIKAKNTLIAGDLVSGIAENKTWAMLANTSWLNQNTKYGLITNGASYGPAFADMGTTWLLR